MMIVEVGEGLGAIRGTQLDQRCDGVLDLTALKRDPNDFQSGIDLRLLDVSPRGGNSRYRVPDRPATSTWRGDARRQGKTGGLETEKSRSLRKRWEGSENRKVAESVAVPATVLGGLSELHGAIPARSRPPVRGESPATRRVGPMRRGILALCPG
jgi:hypothetical protein